VETPALLLQLFSLLQHIFLHGMVQTQRIAVVSYLTPLMLSVDGSAGDPAREGTVLAYAQEEVPDYFAVMLEVQWHGL